MPLAIFNGSPRYKKSNSKILAEQFIKGYQDVSSDAVTIDSLAKIKNSEEHNTHFALADTAIVIFPLYTDSMPGIVKLFFESLMTADISTPKNLGFIVHSGFPEAIHSIYLERYLKKLTSRLHCHYLGTVIKGGTEGIQIMPPRMTKKLFTRFVELGKIFARTGGFDETIVAELRKPMHLSPMRLLVFRALAFTGLTNHYWNMNLKKNNAYAKSFDRPYLP